MKKSILAILFVVSTISSSNAQDAKAAAVIDEMQAKVKSLKSFAANFSLAGDGSNVTGNITVKGNKFRLKSSGQEIFNNGKIVSTYVKESNEVNISDFDPSENSLNPAKVYSFDKKQYVYKFISEAKEGAQVIETIELAPLKKGTQIVKVRLKVVKADHTVKSWSQTEKNGKTKTFTISKFVPNLAVDDKFFLFDKTKYPGVEVNDLR